MVKRETSVIVGSTLGVERRPVIIRRPVLTKTTAVVVAPPTLIATENMGSMVESGLFHSSGSTWGI